MLLLINLVFVSCFALACTRFVSPRTVSAAICAFVTFSWGAMVVVTETVGRVSYTRASMTASFAVLALMALALHRLVCPPSATLLPTRAGRRLSVALADLPVKAAAGLWALVVVYQFVLATWIPPLIHDVLSYHLLPAVTWKNAQVVGVLPGLDYRANYFPQNVMILNALSFLFSGSIKTIAWPQVVISGIFWPTAVYVLFAICGLKKRYAVLGAFLASANPQVLQQMCNELSDIAYGAAFLLAVAVAAGGRRLYGQPGIVLGTVTGLAMGTKTSGLIGAFCCVVAWATLTLTSSKRGRSSRLKALLPESFFVFFTMLCTGGATYLANFLLERNPVYPMPLKLGPVEFPSSDLTHMDSFLYVFGRSIWGALGAGLDNLPRLIFGFAPFERIDNGQIAGYGPVITVVTVLAVFLWAARLLLRRGQEGRSSDGCFRTVFMIITIWTVLFYIFMDVRIGRPYWAHACDARYLMPLAALIVLCFWKNLNSFSKRLRSAGAWGASLLFIVATLLLLNVATPKNYVNLSRALALDSSALFYRARGQRLPPDPELFFARIAPDASLILVNDSTRTFPLYLPSFTRSVFMVSPWGPHRTVPDVPGLPPDIVAACKRFVVHENERSGRPSFVWSVPEGAYEVGVPYIEALAAKMDVSTVVSLHGLIPAVEGRLGWTLLWHEEAMKIAVYKLTLRLGQFSPAAASTGG